MASQRQQQAARRNVRAAQRAAREKRTLANLPRRTRSDLVEQAQRGRRRGGRAGHDLQDRNRQQLYERAKELNIPGRSKLGKSELIDAIRRAS